MIEKLISDIEAKLHSENVSPAGKSELLQLLAQLKARVATLEKTSAAAQEKLKSIKSPVEELRSSVEGFEQSHPKLFQAVNNISSTLSNLGI
jgi:septal ring factor EnvC (AmiA/AmiB activator)